MAVWLAKRRGLKNFSVLVSHVLVPPAMTAILESPGNRVQGFLGRAMSAPSWATRSTSRLRQRFHVPIVITGFEPMDMLEGILLDGAAARGGPGRSGEPVQPGRAARGQSASQEADRRRVRSLRPQMARRRHDSAERLQAAREFRDHDAERIFEVEDIDTQESTVCISGLILRA